MQVSDAMSDVGPGQTLPFPSAARLSGVTRARLAAAAFLAIVALIAALAFTRSYMTYGTETDYVGGFLSEARRILSGGPLKVHFHPPFYEFTMVGVWLIVRDWFVTGLLISVASGAGLVVASYSLFRRVAGSAAAIGAVVALLASPAFIAYSALAGSDVFFTFWYIAAFALAVTAMQVERRYLWFVAGLVLGVAVLTRANGIAALLALAAPLLNGRDQHRQTGDLGLMLAGFAAPVGVWIAYALATGSPVIPTLTYGALAQTYFGGDEYRYAGEVRQMLERRFHNMWEVLSYDPAHMAAIYVRDFLILCRRLFDRTELLAFPVNHLAVAGLAFLLLRRLNAALVLVVVSFAAHVLLLNFKPFEARFYLFLVPLFGAAAGLLVAQLLPFVRARRITGPAFAVIVLFAVGALAQSVLAAYPELHSQDALLAEFVTRTKGVVQPNPVVLSSRPHAAFYLRGRSQSVARINDFQELKTLATEAVARGPVYVYVGADEREWWPVARELGGNERTPRWLVSVATSARGDWLLYEYRPEIYHAPSPDNALLRLRRTADSRMSSGDRTKQIRGETR